MRQFLFQHHTSPQNKRGKIDLQKREFTLRRASNKEKIGFRPYLIIFVMTVFFSSAIYLVFTKLAIKQIFCNDSDNTSCPPELLQILDQYRNTPLLFLQIKDSPQLIKDFPQFDALSWQKKYPNSLIFTAHKSPPAYVVTDESSLFLITQSGKITQIEQTTPNLPQIHFKSSSQFPNHSVMPEQMHRTILDIFNLLPKYEINFENISWISETEIIINTSENKTILLRSQDLPDQLKKVKMIYTKQAELPSWNEIDVRFQHTIVR